MYKRIGILKYKNGSNLWKVFFVIEIICKNVYKFELFLYLYLYYKLNNITEMTTLLYENFVY